MASPFDRLWREEPQAQTSCHIGPRDNYLHSSWHLHKTLSGAAGISCQADLQTGSAIRVPPPMAPGHSLLPPALQCLGKPLTFLILPLHPCQVSQQGCPKQSHQGNRARHQLPGSQEITSTAKRSCQTERSDSMCLCSHSASLSTVRLAINSESLQA